MLLPIVYNANRWAIGVVGRDGRSRVHRSIRYRSRREQEFLSTTNDNILVPVADALRGRCNTEFHCVLVDDLADVDDADTIICMIGRAQPRILPPQSAQVATVRPWEDIYHATCNAADPGLVAIFAFSKNPNCSQAACIGSESDAIAFSGCGKGHNVCMPCLISYIRTCIDTLTQCKNQAWFTDLSVRLDPDGYMMYCPGTRGDDCSAVMSVDAYHKIFKDAASDLGMRATERLRVLMSELRARICQSYQ